MKIQTPTEFLSFNGGTCEIHAVAGNKLGDKLMTLNFGDRTVGMKRFYAARAASVEITRLIQVPQRMDITAAQNVVIQGDRYKIEQIQQLTDTNPRATVLTLHKIGVVT
jgi:SPP1 family predicted phage head-tail adaptor